MMNEKKTRKKKSKHQRIKSDNKSIKSNISYKTQLSAEYKANEQAVRLLLENSNFLSETNYSNESIENFFNNNENSTPTGHTESSRETIENNENYNSEITNLSNEATLLSEVRNESQVSASSFLQIDESFNPNPVVQWYCKKIHINFKNIFYNPSKEYFYIKRILSPNVNISKNTYRMIKRLYIEARSRNDSIDPNLLKTLQLPSGIETYCPDKQFYRTLSGSKNFKPVFLEPTYKIIEFPNENFLSLYLKELRFTNHPELQEEHRLANNLDILCEYREQRLMEKITEHLYASLKIERHILNDLLKTIENNLQLTKNIRKKNEENYQKISETKEAKVIIQHVFKVKALREKYYDECALNKQLLENILNLWKQLKTLRKTQKEIFTNIKLKIKVEELNELKIKERQKCWSENYDTDLNEIYREALEEYYCNKRLWQRRQQSDEYMKKPKRPNLANLKEYLRQRFIKCFNNPFDPHIEIIRSTVNAEDFAKLPGPKKIRSYTLHIFFNKQRIAETCNYRLERDLRLNINEKFNVTLNHCLPRDIQIKLYRKKKSGILKKLANIIVPLPIQTSNSLTSNCHFYNINFSSHKDSISGFLRLYVDHNNQIYEKHIEGKLFSSFKNHNQVTDKILNSWRDKRLFNLNLNDEKFSNTNIEVEEEKNLNDTDNETCTLEEDRLRFTDLRELYENKRWNLLHSRYLKNDSRTRDLKCIPMLNHELTFQWEDDEPVIDTGNWIDSIDLHKHETKKYLRNLYSAIENQCRRFNQSMKHQKNLWQNYGSFSWSTLWQIIQLMRQPRPLTFALDSYTPQTIVNDINYQFKVVCNIIRANGLPVRMPTRQHEDNNNDRVKIRQKLKSGLCDDYVTVLNEEENPNVFVTQNLKYSNIRPFIVLSYGEMISRTLTAEGSQPTWNEQLILQLSGSLNELKDDIKISLYDEVCESRLNNDPSIGDVDIYQRFQYNWLGEFRIPITSILKQRKFEGILELDTPTILLGYKYKSFDDIPETIKNDIYVNVDNVSFSKKTIHLWCSITVEGAFDLPYFSTRCLECSELSEVNNYLNEWSLQALKYNRETFLEPFASTAMGKRICLTRLLQPLKSPVDIHSKRKDKQFKSICRFVSLLNVMKSYDSCLDLKSGIWLNNEIILDTGWASPKDLGVLLCNYLLYLGSQCWLVLGMAIPYGDCTFVLYKTVVDKEESLIFIDPCKGRRYFVNDVFCPLQMIRMVIDINNIYFNLQSQLRVSMMDFNFNETSNWLPVFNRKNPAPLGSFHNLNYKYRPSYQTHDLRLNIERKIIKKFNSWRALRKTRWNRAIHENLLNILGEMEDCIVAENGMDEASKYQQLIYDELKNYQIFGFTMNFSYTNLNQLSERIKSTGLHLNNNNEVEFAVAAHIHPYPNNILSIWIILISLIPINTNKLNL